MQLKNNGTSNAQLHYSVKVNNLPDVEYIHIPGGATVEIDDKIFEQLTSTKTLTNESKLVEFHFEESEVLMDRKPVTMKEYEPTGKTKRVNLLKERIKNGEFTVVVRPAVSKEEVAKVLTANGIDFSKMEPEAIMALYDKLA